MGSLAKEDFTWRVNDAEGTTLNFPSFSFSLS